MDHPVIRRTESHFTGARDHSLLRRTWAPPEPERVLVLVHGYAEHSGRYDHVGAWFAARGCAVSAYDHQGHGLSDGPRCHVRRFSDYVDDLEIAVRMARDEHPGIPLFVVGHSMGGLMTASYLVERKPAITGAVLSGPALALGQDAPRMRLFAARLLSAIAPRLSVPSGLDSNGISRDPEVVRAYLADPLIVLKMTARLGAEMLATIERTAPRASEVEAPVLLLHGEDDPLCPADGSRAFHAGLKAEGSELEVFPNLRHEIFNEPEQESVFARLLDWVTGLGDPEPRGGAEVGKLSHIDSDGRARMVDVGQKAVTHRVCVARGEVRMAPETLAAIAEGTTPKGDVLATARLAGIQAAKRTDEWIPLCHSLPLDGIDLDLVPDAGASRVRIEARVEAHARTGVEMEALVAVSAAGLTVYDMCKAIDRGMTLGSVQLVSKSGGKSGEWVRSDAGDAASESG